MNPKKTALHQRGRRVTKSLRWRWNANPGWPCPMPNHQLVHCKKRPEADTGPSSSSFSFFSSSSCSCSCSSSCYIFFTDLCSYSAALLCKGNHKGRMTHTADRRDTLAAAVTCGRAFTFFSLSDPSFWEMIPFPHFFRQSRGSEGWSRGRLQIKGWTKVPLWSLSLQMEVVGWVFPLKKRRSMLDKFFQKENPPDENPQKMKGRCKIIILTKNWKLFILVRPTQRKINLLLKFSTKKEIKHFWGIYPPTHSLLL